MKIYVQKYERYIYESANFSQAGQNLMGWVYRWLGAGWGTEMTKKQQVIHHST